MPPSFISTSCHLVPPRPNSRTKHDSLWFSTPLSLITTIRPAKPTRARSAPSECLIMCPFKCQCQALAPAPAPCLHYQNSLWPLWPLTLTTSHGLQCVTLALPDYDMDAGMLGPYDWSEWCHHVMTQLAVHILCTPNHAMTVGRHVTPISTSTFAESSPTLTDSAIPARGVKLGWKDTPYLHVDGVIGSDIHPLGHNSSP
jgi:hypothetical protein